MVESALNAALIHFSRYDVDKNYRIEDLPWEEDGYDEDMDVNHDNEITLLEYMETVAQSDPGQFQATERERTLAENIDRLLNDQIPNESSTDTASAAYKRLEAARELNNLKDNRAVNALIIAYNKGKGCCPPTNAVEIIASLRQEIVSALAAVAKENLHHDFQLQIQTGLAISIAGVANNRIYDLILEALNDPNTEVQIEAIKGVGQFHIAAAADPLINKLRQSLNDEVFLVPLNIIDALTKIKNSDNEMRINDVLVEALGAQNFEVKLTAALALSKSEDQRKSLAIPILIEGMRRAIEHSNDSLINKISSALLISIGEPVIPALIAELNDGPSENQWPILGILRDMGSLAAPALIETLHNQSNADLKVKIINVLGESGDSRVVSSLILLLNDPSREVKESVIRALGEIGSPEAVSLLVELLKSGGDFELEGAIMSALSQMGSVVIPNLVALIEDPDINWHKKVDIVYMLGNMGEEAIQHLSNIAVNSSDLSYFAIGALAQIGQPAEPALIGLTENANPYCRLRAAAALGEGDEIGTNTLKNILNDNSVPLDIRVEAALVLVYYGDSGALSTLQVLLSSVNLHSTFGVQSAESEIWYLLNDIVIYRHPEMKDQVISFLIAGISSGLYSSYTRARAIEALAEIINYYYESASQYLSIIRDAAADSRLDPYMRQSALEGLSLIANVHPETRSQILPIILEAVKNFRVYDHRISRGFVSYSAVSALVNVYQSCLSHRGCIDYPLDDETARALVSIINGGGKGRANAVEALAQFNQGSFSELSADTANKLFKALKRVIENNLGLREYALVALVKLWPPQSELGDQIINFLESYKDDPKTLDVLCGWFSVSGTLSESDTSSAIADVLGIPDIVCQEHIEQRSQALEQALSGVPLP